MLHKKVLFVYFFALDMISAPGSKVLGGRTLCHSLDQASRSEIIKTILRYFLFFFLQKRFSKKKKITNKHTSKSQTDNAKIKNEK